jgi:hypothetical protein
VPKGIIIGGGVLGGGVIIGVATSGGGSPPPPVTPAPGVPGTTTTTTTSTTTTTTLPAAPTPANLSGNYTVTVRVASDPSGHDRFIGLGQVSGLRVTVDEGGINVQGGSPWVEVSGSFNPSNGSFNARGRGRVAGFNNVNVRFQGRLTSSGLGGDYEMGTGGELPGSQSITYRVEGRKN